MAKVHTLVDTFASFNSGVAPWNSSYGTVALSSGHINVSCLSSYSGLFTSTTYDFTDSHLSAELISIPTGGGNSRNTEIVVQTSNSNRVAFGYVGTQMEFSKTEAGVETVISTGSYNSTSMRWWRISHDTGIGIRAWTSPDGVVWTQFGSTSTTSQTITAMNVHIFCGYYGTETSPPAAQVDNVNTEAATTGTLDTSIQPITASVAGDVHDDATMAATIGAIVADMAGVAAPPSGTMDTTIGAITASIAGQLVHGVLDSSISPITSSASGAVNPIGGFASQIGAITCSFLGETRPFGEHIIRVEPDHRAFLVVDEGTGLIPIKRSDVTNA